MSTASTWLEVFKAFDPQHPESLKELTCPQCGIAAIEMQYVADPKDRMGTLDMWCRVCNHGVHFFRVRVPQNFQFIDTKDHLSITKRIPKYIPMSP
jgi:hypothetical protein